MPTPGGLDADGCFSGCCVVDTDDTPTILYTGVRLRSNPDCPDLPPPECDLNLPFVESQLAAVPEDGFGPPDHNYSTWSKLEEPFLACPPPDMGLVGWRDPFIFERKGLEGNGREWGMLLGSGLKDGGGAVMIYRSDKLRGGWRYDGMLCEAENAETGAMWECPLLCQLPTLPEPRRLTNLASLRAAGGLGAYGSSCGGAGPPSGPMSPSKAAGCTLPPLPRKASFTTPGGGAPGGGAPGGGAPANPFVGGGGGGGGPGTGGLGPGGTDREPAAGAAAGAVGTMPPPDEQSGRSLLTEQLGAGKGPGPGSLASTAENAVENGGLYGGGGASGGGWELAYTHFLCVSPDAPTNPVLYWLGNFDAEKTRFLLDTARGPLRLDLGDLLYAPNLLRDDRGRHIMWGWLQERRKVGTYEYAGCLTVPRVLYLRSNALIQEPVEEVLQLRRGECWRASGLQVYPEASTPLEGVAGSALDVTLVLERGTASAAGLLVRSWHAGGEGGAALLYDWERGVLECVFEAGTGDDLATRTELDPEDENQRRVGGAVAGPRLGESLTMRVLLDHSCVEVFLGSGEVLATRVYRGRPPLGADAGLDLVAYGGVARVERIEAWEMGTIWKPTAPEHEREAQSAAMFDAMFDSITSVMPMGSPVAVT
ncbi:hypothetical protein WJX81_006531 [Elliptochloris bilobata]|uniref:beta-fructofuranosidase n=1 Tax=Elliptochloris bilobata TaxID=381761 RepID=A0AAW1QJY5_9CHLO